MGEDPKPVTPPVKLTNGPHQTHKQGRMDLTTALRMYAQWRPRVAPSTPEAETNG